MVTSTPTVNQRLQSEYSNIWVVGGAKTAQEFINLKLFDDIRISIMPIMLGNGLLFFGRTDMAHRLHLKEVSTYKDGMVELWYKMTNVKPT